MRTRGRAARPSPRAASRRRAAVVRMQRGEHEVARHRGVDGDFRGLPVADFADQDHVRILTQERCVARSAKVRPILGWT